MMINCNARTMKKLKVLQKALPKQSIRNYGACIGIEEDKAAISDGFYLMYCDGLEPMEKQTVNGDFLPCHTSFPNWRAILPSPEGKQELPAMQIFQLIKSLGAVAGTKNIYLAIENGKPSLVAGNDHGGQYFNPSLVIKAIKALDKNTLPESAWLNSDGSILQLDFTDGFHIIMVSLDKEKVGAV